MLASLSPMPMDLNGRSEQNNLQSEISNLKFTEGDIDPVNPVKIEKENPEPRTQNLEPSTLNLQPASGGVDPQYTYDLNGNRTSMIGPGGMTWAYEYDAANRLTKITNPNYEETIFTYDANNRRTSLTYANGVTTTYSYDDANRLVNLSTDKADTTNISTYTYTFNNVDSRMSMTDNYGTHNYQYNDVYRLTNATHPQAYNPGETFNYDGVGNRQSSHLSAAYNYDNLNRLLEDDQYTYSYDDNGNLTSRVDKTNGDTTTYQYDEENRLILVVPPTGLIEYQYDGFGRRIAKMVNGEMTKFVYDYQNILFELDESDNIKAGYTHGLWIDEPFSVDRDTDGDGVFDATYYYHYDGLGSITAMTDASGSVVQTYVYDSFGRIVQQTGSIENSYTYTGREWDAEAGLYYYRARYYDPGTGRFIQEDPIGFAGGDANFYVYVVNDPVNLVDPDGLGWNPWDLIKKGKDVKDVYDKSKDVYDEVKKIEKVVESIDKLGSDATTPDEAGEAVLDIIEFIPFPVDELNPATQGKKILEKGAETVRGHKEGYDRAYCIMFGCPDDSGIGDDGDGGSDCRFIPLTTTSDTTQSRSDF